MTHSTPPRQEELASLWVEAYGKIGAAPFIPHNCPLCSVGRLGAMIVPLGVGVSLTLTCNADASHHVNITSGAQANDQ